VRKNLQVDKSLFPLLLPTTSLRRDVAEHEAAPEDPTKRKKRSLKPLVSLYQFFTIFSLISSIFSFGMKKLRALSNFSA